MRDNKIPQKDIVAVSSYTDEEHIQKCYKVGIDDYVSKPISIEKFKEVLSKRKIL